MEQEETGKVTPVRFEEVRRPTLDDTVGLIYNPIAAGGLSQALGEAQSIRREALRPGIDQRLRELSWDGIAHTTLEAYRA